MTMDRDGTPALFVHAPAADRAVRTAIGDLAADLARIDPALTPGAEALVRAGATGKRLRPARVAGSFAAPGGGDPAAVLGAGTAVELVHTSALVHDDVIDRSPTRRGQSSLHAEFTAAHGDGWSGTAEDYGRSIAILLGDVLLAAASEQLLACTVPHAVLLRAHTAFTRLQVEVMAGQFLDVDAAARRAADRARALTIATLKSGRYSVSRPLELGALLAGADPTLAAALLHVGDPLGVAFQLGDDLLGVFGDPDETGKPSGADLVEGKRTLLVAEATARLEGPDRDLFAARIGAEGMGPEDVAMLRDLMESSGARAAVEDHLRAAADEARKAIDGLPLPRTRRAELHELADWMTTRRH
jgi:geranylgeranyl diphosphate synthase type I